MENRVALVTGGTRGIGKAICEALEADGVRVVPAGTDYDLNNYFSRQNLIGLFDRIDILVNCAGAQYSEAADGYNLVQFERQITLMLTAPFHLSRMAKPLMRPGSHIVNILSTAAFQGARNIVGYVAAKHGLLGLTRALAIEWAPDIHVNAIAPGLTDTDMIADMTPERRAFLESITPAGRFCKPEEVADALMYLVNSTAVYGQTITVDGGWMAKNG